MKGESAYLINKEAMVPLRFERADGFSKRICVTDVRAYVERQEEHHLKKSFEEEVEESYRSTASRVMAKATPYSLVNPPPQMVGVIRYL